ncbi:unnamed protein product [Mycena citricolor]|uniref:NAD-dependent epimerase/dehydratase domain-containing protein n=1 Tax=Mycena citricolor TaxID=2018698 RepID=A0AAD2K459_9AGAR|nr:unnamed protein product [Mycena citricolor]
MPTISTAAKVLVSGANGFLATWVVRSFLEQGYTVRGTIRSASKGANLKELFKSYGDKLELVVVPDITAVRVHGWCSWARWRDDDAHVRIPGGSVRRGCQGRRWDRTHRLAVLLQCDRALWYVWRFTALRV